MVSDLQVQDLHQTNLNKARVANAKRKEVFLADMATISLEFILISQYFCLQIDCRNALKAFRARDQKWPMSQ